MRTKVSAKVRSIKANLNLSEVLPVNCKFAILLQLKLTKLKREVHKSQNFSTKYRDMSTDELAINRKNLLKFDFSSSLLSYGPKSLRR